MDKNISFTLKVWRQKGPKAKGAFETYQMKDIPGDTSFLEMLDILNEQLISEGKEPVVFDHDCREGICGMCSLYINGHPHGPATGATTCQIYIDRKSTRLNSSHGYISYAVFCLKKCGSLAMIFALLSKGGATSMSSMAMTSFWIAFAAVVITLIIYIGSFAAMLHEYGSIEGILKEYQNLTGIDYNELLQQMNTAK